MNYSDPANEVAVQADTAASDPDPRVRGVIIDALYNIIRGGKSHIKLRDVTNMTGINKETTLEHFDNLESVIAALTARAETQMREIGGELPTSGAADQRIHQFLKRRIRMFEFYLPFRQAADRFSDNSEVIKHNRVRLERELRDELLRSFEKELKKATTDAVEAIHLVCCFDTWRRLREQQSCSRRRAARVMERALRALIDQQKK